MSGVVRGIEKHQEHAATLVARDTRPLGMRFADFLCNPTANLTLYFAALSSIWIFPFVADVVFLISALICLFVISRKFTLPFKLPETSKLKDYNDCPPGSNKPGQAAGISFFGNERSTGEELWFTNSDMRTHALIFGSTGSGKTEALVSLAYNSLIHASGFIYVDGKGDNSLFAKIFSMVRKMGREDDLLVINFMTGARDVVGPQANKMSSTMNPFANGSSSMLSQLVVSLMDQASGDANGDMWKGRAINFVESLMKILTVMRDEGHILLDANTIRDYFRLEKLETIVVDKKFPVGDSGHSVPIEGYPSNVIDPIRNYVINLPGYNPAKKGKQAGEVLEQHGFITMQLTRVFGSLADTYGHILRTNLAEVDIRDVVLNRRILVVLLPALEKSPEELSNLGKIIIASLKAMMAAGLGDAIEGDYRDVVSRKPTNSPSPYVCIMDEYGYYAVKGFAIVAAQARSLGFSAIFAGQDLPAFQKASKEEAASIGANCNIKICMKLEDPQETWEFFNKAAGETYVTNVSNFQMNPGSMTMDYMDTRSTSVDRRQRIELLDLKDQREGEAHIFFKSTIIRAEMFYANPKPVRKLQVNAFLKVNYPPAEEMHELHERINKFSKIIKDPSKSPEIALNEDIAVLQSAFNESHGLRPVERGISGFVTLLEHEISSNPPPEVVEQEKEIIPETVKTDDMDIFSNVPVTPAVERMIGPNNKATFSKPIVRAETILRDMQHIERLAGKTQIQADEIIKQLYYDLTANTKFPKDKPNVIFDKNTILEDLNKLIQRLGGTPPPAGASGTGSPSMPPFSAPNLPPLPDLDMTKFEMPDFAKPEIPPMDNTIPPVQPPETTSGINNPSTHNIPHMPEGMPANPFDFNNLPFDPSKLPNLPDLPDLPNLQDLEKMEQQIKDLDLSALGLDKMPKIDDDAIKKMQELLKSLDKDGK